MMALLMATIGGAVTPMTMRNMGHSGGGGGEEAGEAAMVITDVGRDKGRWD